MDEVSKLKKQVAIYGLAVIAVCEIVSLFIIGFDIGICRGTGEFLAAGILFTKDAGQRQCGIFDDKLCNQDIDILCSIFYLGQTGTYSELGRLPDRDTRTKSSSLLLQCCQAGL